MKKNSFWGKLVAGIVVVAATATACYVFRDKIKAFLDSTGISETLSGFKKSIKELMPESEDEDDYFFFDDDDDFVDDVDSNTASEREYVSITITTPNDTSIEVESEPEQEEPAVDPTKDEVVPEAYENEGLSDVEDDADALEEEASLDGAISQ